MIIEDLWEEYAVHLDNARFHSCHHKNAHELYGQRHHWAFAFFEKLAWDGLMQAIRKLESYRPEDELEGKGARHE